jgi:hypothetical protein
VAQIEHDGGTDVNGGAFAADRQSTCESKPAHEYLAYHYLRPHQIRRGLTAIAPQRRDHLGDAAPLCAAKVLSRQPRGYGACCGRYQQWDPRAGLLCMNEKEGSNVEQMGICDDREADDGRA